VIMPGVGLGSFVLLTGGLDLRLLSLHVTTLSLEPRVSES
jgi:hypothetical protein